MHMAHLGELIAGEDDDDVYDDVHDLFENE
jgi:hypothetical protein